jgi:hypothetical protein
MELSDCEQSSFAAPSSACCDRLKLKCLSLSLLRGSATPDGAASVDDI